MRQHCGFSVASGHNTTARLLLQGIPVLICPTQLEQTVLALRIHGRGLAEMISPPKEVDFTRLSSGALGQRALPESLAAQGRDGWPSRPHMCLLPWMTCPSVPLGPDAFEAKPAVRERINSVARSARLQERVREFSARYAQISQADVVQSVVSRCLALAGVQ
jgi:hypothetical protein